MAKDNDVVQSHGGDGGLGTVKGVIVLGALAGIAISSAYNAGRTVSNKVLKEVRRERRKGERDRRRDSKERRKEVKRQRKLKRF